MQIRTLMAVGIAAAALVGCADDYRTTASAPTTTTTTVTRDYWGNPVSQSTVTRDAYGNPVASNSNVYPGQPVYSGSSMPPAVAVPGPTSEVDLARRAAQHPDCRATLLHQDRPGGSNYDPARGAPSCIDLLGR